MYVSHLWGPIAVLPLSSSKSSGVEQSTATVMFSAPASRTASISARPNTVGVTRVETTMSVSAFTLLMMWTMSCGARLWQIEPTQTRLM